MRTSYVSVKFLMDFKGMAWMGKIMCVRRCVGVFIRLNFAHDNVKSTNIISTFAESSTTRHTP